MEGEKKGRKSEWRRKAKMKWKKKKNSVFDFFTWHYKTEEKNFSIDFCQQSRVKMLLAYFLLFLVYWVTSLKICQFKKIFIFRFFLEIKMFKKKSFMIRKLILLTFFFFFLEFFSTVFVPFPNSFLTFFF